MSLSDEIADIDSRIARLRDAKLKAEIRQAEEIGAVKSIISEFRSDYGVSSIEEAQRLLNSMKSEAQTMADSINEILGGIDGQ